LRNSNKQNLILIKFYVNNVSSIVNQTAKYQLNLPMQTIVTATSVRLPQNVKCPAFTNRLFNPASVHGLPANSAINFLAPYPFSCLNSLTKHGSLQKIPFCHCHKWQM